MLNIVLNTVYKDGRALTTELGLGVTGTAYVQKTHRASHLILLRAHSISAVPPAAPDTVPFPVSDLPVDSHKEACSKAQETISPYDRSGHEPSPMERLLLFR